MKYFGNIVVVLLVFFIVGAIGWGAYMGMVGFIIQGTHMAEEQR